MAMALVLLTAAPVIAAEPDLATQRERFGQQLFKPDSGLVIEVGAPLPALVWEKPEAVAAVTEDASIRTRWFDEERREVKKTDQPGRYFAYGEATGPGGSAFRRAMTCVCVPRGTDLVRLAEEWTVRDEGEARDARQARMDSIVQSWRHTEAGAVQLAAMIESGGKPASRLGQWQMETATRHVRLKRKLMGLDDKPPVVVSPRRIEGDPATVLRRGSLEEAEIGAAQVAAVEAGLDEWYAHAKEPTAIVISKNGVIVLAKSYGGLDGKPVTIDTPMLLHSAMKPLMGIQLAMYVDQGLVDLEQPVGDFLPAFNSPKDRSLTFRAGHAHLSGIHFPWPLAFSRLFYFNTWQENLIAHQPREWTAGSKYRYGVVGVILSVRSLELISGRNYWDAMEREVFAPLGIQNILPGGVGFSAENLARIGVLLDNHGKYGAWELFSEETYQKMTPSSLLPHFPKVDRIYGVGLQSHASRLGPGSYGHGGGCGTLLSVHPEKNLVFAMVRNEQGPDYKERMAGVMKLLRAWNKE
jgi:CubicO group peptidase (beta-lactamase class C family)